MLLSTPSWEELFRRTTSLAELGDEVDDPVHPSRVINFLVGLRGKWCGFESQRMLLFVMYVFLESGFMVLFSVSRRSLQGYNLFSTSQIDCHDFAGDKLFRP